MADAVGRGGFEALDPCVHCGFCLPACPTYLATADESDSPRGRILLMRALERGELGADDPALVQHLDACLGCRGCEPACPSGVGYGRGLEAARVRLVAANGIPPGARVVLGGFARPWVWRSALAVARFFRATGLPGRFAGAGRLGFLAGMLDATTPVAGSDHSREPRENGADRGSVALFRGCVMDGLFDHVHAATRRTLAVNGYRVIEVPGQSCCGALHEHAGDRAGAIELATRNLAAFAGGADWVVVDSAGCGALLKAYGELVPGAEAWASRVRDVTELLAAAGPRPGGPLGLDVVYDAPCHLQHAQGVQAEALAILRAIPELRLTLLPDSDRCCGAAGLYGVLHPELSRAVLAAKIETIGAARPAPAIVATGNPGCLMQIGAGLKAARLSIAVAHPVELLDRSYREAGYYD
jgi:glycolate oxidase iron-sulfur subunit